MRTRARYLLAVMLLATVLCADRGTVATERTTAELTPARGLVDRLADGFRRTVATRPMVRQRCPWSVATTAIPAPALPIRTQPIVAAPVNLACLPLPPPSRCA